MADAQESFIVAIEQRYFCVPAQKKPKGMGNLDLYVS